MQFDAEIAVLPSETPVTPTTLALFPSSRRIIDGCNDLIVHIFDAATRIILHVY